MLELTLCSILHLSTAVNNTIYLVPSILGPMPCSDNRWRVSYLPAQRP